ncbi:MAG: hypothetical protein KGO48_11400, partial [Alphaproteobacteria bacterium]|nr:hypothetical protein [Alphaproteobacteria bacterium]
MLQSVQRALAIGIVLCFAAGAAFAADIEGKMMTLPSTERQVSVVQFKAPGSNPRPSVLLLHGAGGFGRRIADYNH